MSGLEAGCPADRVGPDVRDLSRMSGLAGLVLLLSASAVSGFPGPRLDVRDWRGAECPGLAPDVRPLMLLAVCWGSPCASAQVPDVRL